MNHKERQIDFPSNSLSIEQKRKWYIDNVNQTSPDRILATD